ncbi:MAG: hypothetical protein HY539_04740 [Deltaproteobacteria bacterium]|nr:hypothetical protein [Deltaproteobacteria bacterium]
MPIEGADKKVDATATTKVAENAALGATKKEGSPEPQTEKQSLTPKTDHYHVDPGTGRKVPHEEFHGTQKTNRPMIWLMQRVAFLKNWIESSGVRPLQTSQQPQKGTGVIVDRAIKAAPRLTTFEKLFIGRYGEEEGKRQPWSGQGSLSKGQFHFAKKTVSEWVSLITKWFPFTLETKGKTGELDRAVFRGVVEKAPMPPPKGESASSTKRETAMLISDLRFLSGKTEKFARIPLSSSAQVRQILAQLEALRPGQLLDKPQLLQLLGSADFPYLVLSRKIIRPELAQVEPQNPLVESARAHEGGGIAYSREATKGLAFSAKTEEMIASQLDLNIRPTSALQQKGESSGIAATLTTPVGGPLGSTEDQKRLFGFLKKRRRREAGEGEALYEGGFVPWYQLVWSPKKWKGKPRWWIPLLYLITISVIVFSIVYLVRFVLPQQ